MGEFVRSHRERLAPTPPEGRRRTPGLRREELAERAGISAIWCAWIEQGREVQASAKTLSGLARALDLSRAERARLFELAGRSDPDLAPRGPPPTLRRAGGRAPADRFGESLGPRTETDLGVIPITW